MDVVLGLRGTQFPQALLGIYLAAARVLPICNHI